MTTCIAYLEDGSLCRAPAEVLDQQMGGLVCREHARTLQSFLYQGPSGTLHFDVPLFLRAHSYADTPQNRDTVIEAAKEAFAEVYPGVPITIVTREA